MTGHSKVDGQWRYEIRDPADPTRKPCQTCKDTKALTEFYMPGDLECKSCARRKQVERRRSKPDFRRIQRNNDLKRKYKITHETYDAMFAAQDGKCAVCGQAETKIDSRTQAVKWLCVDHDHSTGAVRALLCTDCNTALGQLQEDPARIRALLAYAERIRQEKEHAA